ncbi:MAG: hypothetical protein EWV61_17130 [Microcystis aeruginosa Ma_AC_P_19900807_S300]|nr:MAG: hypothetical protein EWV61_17130 [Microcystis aeruginosa Ma_AC_P_19900807_S300]
MERWGNREIGKFQLIPQNPKTSTPHPLKPNPHYQHSFTDYQDYLKACLYSLIPSLSRPSASSLSCFSVLTIST